MKFNNYILFVFILFFLQTITNSVYAQLSPKDSIKLEVYISEAKKASATEDDLKAAHYYNKAGLFCLKKNLYSNSILHFTEAAKFNSNLKNYQELKKIYSNLGLMYFNLEKLDQALFYFNKSLNIRKFLKKEKDISSGLIDIAYVFNVKRDYNKSIELVKEALVIAQKIKNTKLILICYRMLANIYKEKKEIKKAEEYFEKYSTFNVNYQNKKDREKQDEEEIQTIAELNMEKAEKRANQLEFELKAKQSKLYEDSIKRESEKTADSLEVSKLKLSQSDALNEVLNQKNLLKDAKLQEEEAIRENQRLWLFFGVGLFILILALAIVLFRNMRKEKKQKQNIEYKNKILQSAFTKLEGNNKEIAQQKKDIEDKSQKITTAFVKIEEQNENIEASIKYAQSIQKALLPRQEELNKYFSESFILFLPRDKVSGDFYWFNEAEFINEKGKKETKFFVSAIDCTGHGVPGALLSMIGFNSLENIVENKKILRPDLILHELNEEVKHILRQNTTDNKDGMDMSLCAYSPERNEIEFAGAKNPVIYIKNNELFHLRGSSKPIAGGKFYEKLKHIEYKNNIIPITEPTTFYIFSDGFPDQIGGNNKRKYLIRRFKELLLSIHQDPMKNQAEALNLILEQWRGKEKQIDDIIIIGFRLGPK